jgi:hypothetical protein
MLPVHWFFALENETGDGRFSDNLERFGLLPDPESPQNPYGLPVGITAAPTRDLRFTGVDMIGVTCAACHVSELVHQGRRYRLDGGSSHADLEAFSLGVAGALTSTIESPAKFLRFLDRLRERTPNEILAEAEAERAAAVARAMPERGAAPPAAAFDRDLFAGLERLLARERTRPAVDLRSGRPILPGPAADAAAADLRGRLSEGLDRATLAAHAPASTAEGSPLASAVPPQDLGAHVHAFLSDGVVTLRLLKARAGLGHELSALMHERTTAPGYGRIDAFGGFRLMLFGETPIAAPVGYPDLWSLDGTKWIHWDANTTSVQERNIGQALGMGAVLDRRTMSSTVSLPNLYRLETIARKTRAPKWESIVGPVDAALAERGAALYATHCASCHKAPGGEAVMPALAEVGTDPNRAQSFAQPVDGRPFAEALGGMLEQIKQRTARDNGITPEELARFEGPNGSDWRTTGRYPARPLVGAWASAPYLHNNSVPTLHDLLLPPAERPVTFHTGSAEYDPVKLGYATTGRPGSFLFDTREPGNGNGGHTYGTTLSPAERTALLEYLKRL